MKKALSLPLLLVGIALLVFGVHSYDAARDGQRLVEDQLASKQVTTPADASIPNALVHDAGTAMSMSEWIDGTMEKATGGRGYQEIGAYLTADGTETGDVTQAARDEYGIPKANPLRQIAFEASAGQTSLGAAVLAIKVGDLAVGLSVVMGLVGTGLLLGAMAIADLHLAALTRRIHLPHAHLHHA